MSVSFGWQLNYSVYKTLKQHDSKGLETYIFKKATMEKQPQKDSEKPKTTANISKNMTYLLKYIQIIKEVFTILEAH